MPINPGEIIWDEPDNNFLSTATKFFVDRGYHPYQAAGIAGNLMHESGGRPDILHDKGAGYGLAGWNGPRRQNLYKFAGTATPTLEQQLDFVDYELRNHETKAYEALQKTRTPEQAAQVFSKLYERPGKPMMGSRIKLAQQAITGLSMKNAKGMTAGPGGKVKINPDEIIWDEPGGVGGINPDEIIWDDQALDSIDMGALADPFLVGAAGSAVGHALDIPFIPLRKALEFTHRNLIEPVRQRDITSQGGGDIPAPGLGAPEAFAPLAEEKAFVPVMEFSLAPAYLRLLGKTANVLKRVGNENFYKHAPDWMFRRGEAGLPEVLPPERISAMLAGMSGEQRAAMARKYPDFKDVLTEWYQGTIKPEIAAIPEQVAAGPGVIGRAAVAGELVEPQLKLPPGQGFDLRPKTVLRKAGYPGEYLAVEDVIESPPVGHVSLSELGIKPKVKSEGVLTPAQIIKKHGGFNPKASILRDFEPEERRALSPFMRKGAQGPDELLQELQSGYPGVFDNYENDADFLRGLLNKELRQQNIKSLLDSEAEHYTKQNYDDIVRATEERAAIKAENQAMLEAEREGRDIQLTPEQLDSFFEGLETAPGKAIIPKTPKVVPVEPGIIPETPGVAKQPTADAAAAFRQKFGTAKKEDVRDVVRGGEPGKTDIGSEPPDAIADQELKHFYAGLPIPNLTGLIKKFGVDVSDKDMGIIKRLGDLPNWIAKDYPRFGKIFERQRARDMERTAAISTFMDELEPHIKHLKSMPKARFKRLNEAAFHFDRIRKEPDVTDFANYGLHKEDLGAYFKVRELLDYVREDYTFLMQEMGAPQNVIDEIRREMGKIPGYIPHRRQGRYYVGAKEPVEPKLTHPELSEDFSAELPGAMPKDKLTHYELYDDLLATMTFGKISPKGKKIADRLKQENPGAEIFYGKLKEMPEDYFWQVDSKNMQAVIDAAVDKLELGPVSQESLKQSLVEAAAKTFKERGFGAHGIKRKDIPGYDQSDFMKSAIEFINGYFGFKTKMRAAGDFSKGLSAIPPKTGERLYAQQYVRDMLQNSSILDRTVDRARGYMFLHFIGFAPRQLLLQSTQNFVAGVPVLQRYTKWSSAKLTSEMAKSMADLVRPGGKAARLTADELAGLETARQKGVVTDLMTQEYMGYIADKFGRAGMNFNKAAGFIIGNAEKFNRETMYVTAYRIAKNELKKDPLDAMKFAEDMVDQTHFIYGKVNLPQAFRGADAKKILRSAYTFRTYNHNLLRLYWDLAKNQGAAGQQSVMKGLAALLTFGGLTSIPFYKDLEKFYQQRTGKNIRTEIKKNMGDYADYINYGLPNLVGVDLSGSMSIEALEKPEDIFGVPTGLTKQVLRGVESAQKGDYLRAAEDVAPSVLRGPISAYRVGTEGMTTRGGKIIRDAQGQPVTMTPAELGLKAAGFRPTKAAEFSRQFEAEKTAKDIWESRRKKLVESYRTMENRYGRGSKEVAEIRNNISQFNADLNKQGVRYISPIKSETLKQKRDSKRTRELKREFE